MTGRRTGLTVHTRWKSDYYDPRVKAVVSFAGVTTALPAFQAPIHTIHAPLMIFGGTADRTISYEDEQVWGFERANPPKFLVGVIEALDYLDQTDPEMVSLPVWGDIEFRSQP